MTSTLILFALLQQPTADELLAKVADKYLKAKTVSMTVKIALERKEGDNVTKGEWTIESKFKEGNRSKLVVNGTKAKDYTVVCDGKKTSHGEPGHSHAHDATADYAEGLRTYFAKTGYLVGLSAVEDISGAKSLKPENAKLAADEKIGDRAVKVVEYTIKLEGGRGEMTLKHKIYIDAETSAILKRDWSDEFGTTVTETHSDVKFDAEIADDTFSVK